MGYQPGHLPCGGGRDRAPARRLRAPGRHPLAPPPRARPPRAPSPRPRPYCQAPPCPRPPATPRPAPAPALAHEFPVAVPRCCLRPPVRRRHQTLRRALHVGLRRQRGRVGAQRRCNRRARRRRSGRQSGRVGGAPCARDAGGSNWGIDCAASCRPASCQRESGLGLWGSVGFQRGLRKVLLLFSTRLGKRIGSMRGGQRCRGRKSRRSQVEACWRDDELQCKELLLRRWWQ